MTPDDIIDRRSLESWLLKRSPRDWTIIAFRSVLRSGLGYWEWSSFISGKEADLNSVLVLRAALSVHAACIFRTPEVALAAQLASGSANHAASFPHRLASIYKGTRKTERYNEILHAAAVANLFAQVATVAEDGITQVGPEAQGADKVVSAASLLIDEAVGRAFDGRGQFWQRLREDCELNAGGVDILRQPLWKFVDAPGWDDWVSIRDRLEADPVWSFWLEWYQGLLEGREIDAELIRAVALIPNDVWGAGPDAVAREIALIEERRRLLGLVQELRGSLGHVSAVARGVASPEHRAHNQPPELLDAPVQIREAVAVIAVSLDEAEAELMKADPSPSTLSRIATTLSDAVLAALEYCGAKADVFITKAVEAGGSAFGKWGFAGVIAYWATPTGSMQSLINGLLDLASKLSH